ncbi:MAG: hypothetical protein OXI87_24775 [Albidovulum sp.]|nr:hypothetical protein [Albidovulum sp.]
MTAEIIPFPHPYKNQTEDNSQYFPSKDFEASEPQEESIQIYKASPSARQTSPPRCAIDPPKVKELKLGKRYDIRPLHPKVREALDHYYEFGDVS